ncbi:MAG: OmpA family protein, partial [Chitinivibrionales bacterium]|nr:OmpA family protein [Chitinivibrionales bacterium]
SLDTCPNAFEDRDGFEDVDGCPDPDNDKDGIVDSLDKCPNEPEDIDGFQDNDGCVDLDNDNDRLPDLKDKCPNDSETVNGYQDEDGCPDTKPTEPTKQSLMPRHQILEGVAFVSGSADITYASFQYLDPIIKELKEYPNIEIEVRGHTDSVGKNEMNMSLSQRRADAIRLYLIKNGIDAGRVRAIGYGSSSPISDNRTASGRAKNRRIEIVRTK